MKEDGSFDTQFNDAERIGYLIASFIKGTLTPLERRELDEWILLSDENEKLFEQLTDEENIAATMAWYAGLNQEKAWKRLQGKINFRTGKKTRSPIYFVAIAASFIIVVGLSIFFAWPLNHSANKPNKSSDIATNQDPLPGTDRAILTVSGNRIILDSTAQQKLALKNISIKDGTVIYNGDSSGAPSENQLNVPRGGQYKLILSDGTKVWLNAESSLSYASVFTGSQRRVLLTGEAYFEVTKNKEKPFIVESAGNTIKVLGTQFNVNSYGDEQVFTTTLVEGSVEISRGKIFKTLKPGQQARVNGTGVDVLTVDTKEATAWKDGEFLFRNTPVNAIVSQLARWYDLEVEFKEPVDKHINATIKRDVPLSKVLHYLEETGDVHFKVEGRTLIVYK
jgi:transmembrane sensor